MKNSQHLANLLKDAGIISFDLEARWLLKYSKKEELESNINRRLKLEPLAKILGSKGFYKYEFFTTKDTLDPRPESELLVLEALSLIPDKSKNLRILDICSGTGCLGLSVLMELPNATLSLLDVSLKAMEVAKKNAFALGVLDRCNFVVKDMKEFEEQGFDIILFNPPYLRVDELEGLDKETKYDPMLALDGGDDGLIFYKNFNEKCLNGFLILEIGQNQEGDVQKIMDEKGLKLLKIEKDIQSINRMMAFEIK